MEMTMPASAQTFRDLHHQATVLRLSNAWDAGSARLFESLGATAIATTSAGVAWSQGYADGRRFRRCSGTDAPVGARLPAIAECQPLNKPQIDRHRGQVRSYRWVPIT
jgi:hypothetical protein